MSYIDFIVIAVYVAGLMGLGFWVSFRRKESQDYFLAGKNLGWKTIGLSIFGTNISPMMLISSSGVAFAYGMVANNFEWLAWIFLVLMAMVFLPYYLSSNISTMPEFILKRFGKPSRNFLSWLIFFQITIGIGSVLYAGAILMGQILDWPLGISLLLITFISASFTITGGLEAVAITDAFQSILMIVACSILSFVGIMAVGGFEELYARVPSDHWVLFRPASDSAYPWPAIVLGYPVMAIWYWCANQTIVQRALGAKSLKEAQKGILFTSYLKILVPIIFFLPGIVCVALYPDLEDPDSAFMTMVVNHLPSGMIGLIVSVLLAALISTVNSMLNSASTIFTLDIYKNVSKTPKSQNHLQRVGQVVTGLVAFLGLFIAYGLSAVKGMNLFDLINSIFSFLSPSLAVVFLLGITWKKSSRTAAYYTLVLGNIPCIIIGVLYLAGWPSKEFWPHFLMLSFYLFAGLLLFMVFLSYWFPDKERISWPTLRETYLDSAGNSGIRNLWIGWAGLAVIMGFLYVIFN